MKLILDRLRDNGAHYIRVVESDFVLGDIVYKRLNDISIRNEVWREKVRPLFLNNIHNVVWRQIKRNITNNIANER